MPGRGPSRAGPFRPLRAQVPPLASADLAVDTQAGTATGSGTTSYVTIQPVGAVGVGTGSGSTGTPQLGPSSTTGTGTGSGTTGTPQVAVGSSVGAASASGTETTIGEGIPTTVGVATASGTESSVTVTEAVPQRVLGLANFEDLSPLEHVVHTQTGTAFVSGGEGFVTTAEFPQETVPEPLRALYRPVKPSRRVPVAPEVPVAIEVTRSVVDTVPGLAWASGTSGFVTVDESPTEDEAIIALLVLA